MAGRTDSRGEALLAEAMVVAETRVGAPIAPGTPGPAQLPDRARAGRGGPHEVQSGGRRLSGHRCRGVRAIPQASLEVALGNPEPAIATYQQVIDRAGDRIYGQMARLGLAEAQARSGQYHQAINAFKELAQVKEGPLPVDAVLMQLGLTYRDAGKPPMRSRPSIVGRGIPGMAFLAAARANWIALKKPSRRKQAPPRRTRNKTGGPCCFL